MFDRSYKNLKKYLEEHPEAEKAYISQCPNCHSYVLVFPHDEGSSGVKIIYFKTTLFDVLREKLRDMCFRLKPTKGKIYSWGDE